MRFSATQKTFPVSWPWEVSWEPVASVPRTKKKKMRDIVQRS